MKLNRIVLIAIITAGCMVSLIFALGILGSDPKQVSNIQAPSTVDSKTTEAVAGPQTPATPATPISTTVVSTAPNPTTTASPTTTTVTTAPPTPTPTPTPPTTIPCGQSGGSCTSAQVAAHNSAANCWVIYNGYYYIVTSYVSNHPGGSSVFNSATCGHDISGYLSGAKSSAGEQYNHKQSAYNVLASYKVGAVQ